ncbi:unnamed protein product [Lactuca saligna]|uniref:Uncharacterized protein n=1 Tax=Lactuca saligna TaxID=75948 RepID=A0AA36DW78_LACSI|nr:unnamed protein product [Lactuca saligna]
MLPPVILHYRLLLSIFHPNFYLSLESIFYTLSASHRHHNSRIYVSFRFEKDLHQYFFRIQKPSDIDYTANLDYTGRLPDYRFGKWVLDDKHAYKAFDEMFEPINRDTITAFEVQPEFVFQLLENKRGTHIFFEHIEAKYICGITADANTLCGRLERAGRAKNLPKKVKDGVRGVESHQENTPSASIIVVGDEIISGKMEDELRHLLCRKLHSIRSSVSHIAVVSSYIL